MCILFWKKKKHHVAADMVSLEPVIEEDEASIFVSHEPVVEEDEASIFVSHEPISEEDEALILGSDVFISKETAEDTVDDLASVLVSDVCTPKDAVEDISDIDKKEIIQKYHVSQNKDKDQKHSMMWRVRKEGSKKTIQFFDTQKEAIDYAQGLADRSGSTVVIHKLDGSIRK